MKEKNSIAIFLLIFTFQTPDLKIKMNHYMTKFFENFECNFIIA